MSPVFRRAYFDPLIMAAEYCKRELVKIDEPRAAVRHDATWTAEDQ